MENFEQKYNKLVNAIKVLQETNPSDEGIQNWVNDNVPELRESEDERIREEIANLIMQSTCNTKEFYRKRELIEWLEKQGQKPTWSEEDECMLNNVINVLEPLSQTTHSGYAIKSMITWLKSIKPQNRWKPTDEQMEALANALSLAKNCGDESSFDLRTLYDDLTIL